MKGVAAISRRGFLYAKVWLMARSPLAKELRSIKSSLKVSVRQSTGKTHQNWGNSGQTNNMKVSQTYLAWAGFQYSRTNRLRYRAITPHQVADLNDLKILTNQSITAISILDSVENLGQSVRDRMTLGESRLLLDIQQIQYTQYTPNFHPGAEVVWTT